VCQSRNKLRRESWSVEYRLSLASINRSFLSNPWSSFLSCQLLKALIVRPCPTSKDHHLASSLQLIAFRNKVKSWSDWKVKTDYQRLFCYRPLKKNSAESWTSISHKLLLKGKSTPKTYRRWRSKLRQSKVMNFSWSGWNSTTPSLTPRTSERSFNNLKTKKTSCLPMTITALTKPNKSRTSTLRKKRVHYRSTCLLITARIKLSFRCLASIHRPHNHLILSMINRSAWDCSMSKVGLTLILYPYSPLRHSLRFASGARTFWMLLGRSKSRKSYSRSRKRWVTQMSKLG